MRTRSAPHWLPGAFNRAWLQRYEAAGEFSDVFLASQAAAGLSAGLREPRPPMLHTSLIVELLRSQPRLTFWIATLAQAGLWWLVPSLLYSAPPGELPLVLAIGHQFELGSAYGPPVAFWLAEIAYEIAGSPGVYLLAQACVVLTYYAVFSLARAIVGIHHAAFAVLLMVGISAFTAPTPNFGPAVLAMPVGAFTLLYLWRAIGERRRAAWYLLAMTMGLLLLTTYAGLILLAATILFLLATRRGRRTFRTIDPWLAAMLFAVVVLPHLVWLDIAGVPPPYDLRALIRGPSRSFLPDWLDQLGLVSVGYAGVAVLLALAGKWFLRGNDKVPVFVRSFTDPFGRRFVYFFAVMPILAATAGAVWLHERLPAGQYAPFLVLSGLAVVVFAGNAIPWHRPRLVAAAWLLLLVVPPLSAAAAILALPWLAIPGVEVSRPAVAMGRFFADSFERRTGTPLAIVAGDPRIAALVALGAPTRPSLFFDAMPERSPWTTAGDIRRKGAVVLWDNANNRADVPADIGARFPGLIAEVPQAFARTVQGELPLLRIGWGVVRPQPETR
jgi:hypothetical protein